MNFYKFSQQSQRGFTLVEMLVTLALLAMISALLWQAMQQVMRVERVLQRSGVEGQLDAVRREWLRGLIQSSFVEEMGSPRQLQGDARQMTLASAEAVGLAGMRSNKLQIRLESDSPTGRQRLLLSEVPTADAFQQELRGTPRTVELLTWVGKPGSIKFLGGDGEWQDHWPPPVPIINVQYESDLIRAAQAALPRLPVAVMIELGDEAGGALVTRLSVTEPGRTSRRSMEQ
ncbi:prepilin-type N-terminal cleavage/methylation domain-containing protein [Roseateles asaccharophilus]|uniref:Prepilin-type N-terminal cleavage/methylation domain-containing protein n=1 Tax=Roseateles asaccharophilus TaxID=582607 RepID=A0ABU2ABX5_9BURK|nr:prepilin-type N-terminal cleavage/methylation domain-containing protein [Roseateles asaccharophilus]MDR7334711.1 prepilin-type N-terminal cleavage/methylation domain-containing protein [Roseateles asaccharophilus]